MHTNFVSLSPELRIYNSLTVSWYLMTPTMKDFWNENDYKEFMKKLNIKP